MEPHAARHRHNVFSKELRTFLLVLSAVMLFAACRGNGGSAYSGGPTYVPGGGSASGSSDGGSSDDSNSFTADDLWKLSNAGNVDRVVELFQTGFSGGTCTVVMSAADLGLPAGGTVTLTITGSGISYTADATADEDGNVTFIVPLLERETVVTVGLTVTDSNGRALYTGSEQQEVEDDGNLHVGLVRLFWTLPSTLKVKATPKVIPYNAASAVSDSTTFSVENLGTVPAGITLNYSWKDATGNELSTGATLTQTVSQITGPGYSPPSDGATLTKAYTVTITCIDEVGASCTATGSGTVTIGVPVTIPVFSIDVTKPTGSSIESGSIYALANKTNPFTFKAVEAAGTSFPTGTIFSWTITDGSGHTVTKLGQEVTVSPDGDGLSAGLYSPGSNWTVSCTASHPGAEDDRVAAPGSFYVYKITIPAITGMSMDKPASATGASSPYCIKNMSDTFGFTVQWTSGAILHADTVLTWSVSTDGGTTWTTVSGETSSTANIAPNEFGTIGFGSASATSCQVKCTASHPALPDTENKSWSISFGLYRCFPAFSIGISTTTLPSRLDSSGNTIYTVRQSNIDGGTDGLTLTATLTDAAVAAGESFLSGTTFTWKVESTTLSGTGMDAQSVSPSLSSMGISTIGAAATSPAATEYTVTCTAKYGVLESGEVTETCRISPPIKLDSSYGQFRTGYGITLQATSYSGDRGTYLHLNISGTAADDATTNATFYNNRSSVIPAAANATYNWYLGKSNNPNKTPIINGSKTLLGSIAYTDDANGYYNITVSNLKSQISAYNIVFLQVAPGTSGDALNYETSDLTAVVAFNDEIRYTN